MQIQTSRFGVLEVPEKELYSFPGGLPGVPGKQFALVPSREDPERIAWLQSIEAPEIALLLVDPRLLVGEFHANPKAEEIRELEPKDGPSSLECRVFVRSAETEGELVANLFAPVFLNRQRRLGMQVPLVGSEWELRERWPLQKRETKALDDDPADVASRERL
jgi:flagellar assembly factor FliW